MDREQIIDLLRRNEPALRARGVTHAALFGSRARGDSRADSDTDIMIDIDDDTIHDIYEYAGLKAFIAELIGGPVDVVHRDALKPHIRPAVTADAVYAF